MLKCSEVKCPITAGCRAFLSFYHSNNANWQTMLKYSLIDLHVKIWLINTYMSDTNVQMDSDMNLLYLLQTLN